MAIRTIITAMLAAGAVTESIIGSGAVTNAKLGAGAVDATVLDLTDDYNFTGTLEKDGAAVADASQVGLQKVKVATTGNISNLATGAPLAVDGVNVSDGDLVLVAAQTNAEENGIYAVTTAGSGSNGVWARAGAFDSAGELPVGTAVVVQAGSTRAGRMYLITAFGGTLDTDDITFTRFDGRQFTWRRTNASGDGSTLAFDLGHASSTGHEVYVGGILQPDSIYTIDVGGGSGGVDQLEFSSGNAPPNGVAVEINYIQIQGA